jgi:hypothetical protein
MKNVYLHRGGGTVQFILVSKLKYYFACTELLVAVHQYGKNAWETNSQNPDRSENT